MRTQIIISTVALAFLVFSCQSENGSRIVAEKFLKAYSEGKFQEAKKYATGRTQKMVEIAGAISLQGTKRKQPAEYEIIECQEMGNRATVKYRAKGSLTSEVIYLVKKDEAWLVGMSE